MKLFAWGWAAVLAAPCAATAQQSAPTENDVVVEARKRAEPAGDVPASVQVVPGAVIEEAHIRSLDELGDRLPNVLLNRRQDNEPNIVIRGVGGFGNVQGAGFYLDDVQNFTDQSAAIEDVERIEVLKGPQGTLYGGSSIGGAVKYILKRPADRFGAELSASYGSFDTAELAGAIDVPVTDTLATRLSAYARRTDGYVANTTLDGRADRAHEDGGRFAVAYKPSADARFLLQLRHNVLDDGGNIYVRVPDASSYRRDVAYDRHAYNDRVVTGGSLEGEFRVADATLTLLTSYTHRSNRFLWDIDYSAADAVALTNGDRHTTRVFTEEARLASAEDQFHWQIGGYYAEVFDRGLTIDANVLLGRAAGGPRLIHDYSNGATDDRQYAVFGTLGYDPGRWRFEVGARLNRDEAVRTVRGDPLTRTEVAATTLLPRASIGYALGPALLYTAVAVGEEPGRVNVASPDGSAYRAEKATSIEAGIKGRLARDRIGYTATFFYTDDRRRQFETLFVNAAGVLTEETTNIGRSTSLGAEATVDASIGRRWTLAAAAGWLDARWADRTARFDLMPIDGLRVPFAPQVTATISAAYRQPIGRALSLRLRADARVTGTFAWDVLDTARQPTYTVANLALTLAPSTDRWSLSVRAENVGDAHYFTEFNPNLFGPRQSLGAPGRPRAVMVELSARR